MATATPVYALPYPVPADPADVPADMGALANRIEAVLGPGSANGQVPVWDNAAKKWVAGSGSGELGYAELTTASIAVSSTTEGSPVDILAAPSITFDGSTAVFVEFYVPRMLTPNDGGILFLNLWDGTTTNLGRLSSLAGVAGGQTGMAGIFRRKLTPSAAAHAYRVRAWATSTAGGPTVFGGAGGAGANVPAYIRVLRA